MKEGEEQTNITYSLLFSSFLERECTIDRVWILLLYYRLSERVERIELCNSLFVSLKSNQRNLTSEQFRYHGNGIQRQVFEYKKTFTHLTVTTECGCC